MAKITAADVSKLRKETGAGMMDCRKALVESDGDFDKAIEYLRKKGQKVAALRSGRETKEGAVVAVTSDDHKEGVVISLNCETDFVAMNEDFLKFVNEVAQLALKGGSKTIEEVLALQSGDKTVSANLTELIGKIGEKLSFKNFDRIEAPYVTSYVHSNNSIAVLVGFTETIDEDAAHDVAMQVAAMAPLAVDAEGVPAEAIEREKEIAKAQVIAEGKPAELADRISQGKVNKFLKENTLMSQPYVKDNKQSIADFLKGINKEVKVTEFKRITLV